MARCIFTPVPSREDVEVFTGVLLMREEEMMIYDNEEERETGRGRVGEREAERGQGRELEVCNRDTMRKCG